MPGASFSISVLSKPVVAGAPVLFIAYDYWWGKLKPGEIVRRNLPSLVFGLAGAALTVLAHQGEGGIKAYRGGSPWLTLQLMLLILWDYLVALVNPTNLNNFYIYDIQVILSNVRVQMGGATLVFSSLRVWLGLAVVAGSVWFAWRQPLGKPISRFAVLWVWVFMLPVSNIVPIAIQRADRYMYYPLIALGALLGAVGHRLWRSRALAATARKLGVNFYHYLHDRISRANQLPNLADLIDERAKTLNLGASWNTS